MRSRLVALLACALAAAALGSCGSDAGRAPQNPPSATTPSTAPPPQQPGGAAQADKRGAAIGCFRSKGLGAELVGDKSIQIEGPSGPRVEFFQNSLEAEGEQFEGRGEGAEQIGAALLYVKGANDDVLNDLELCLNDQ